MECFGEMGIKLISDNANKFIHFISFFVFNVGNEKLVQTQMVANILVVIDNNFHKLDGKTCITNQ